MRFIIAALVLATASDSRMVSAQGAHGPAEIAPTERPRSEEARAGHPQPVVVGTLLGRMVLEDVSEQRVLGRVAAVARDAGGGIGFVVECCGVLGFGSRRVTVPLERMALLGQFVVARGFDSRSIAALPDASPSPASLLPAGEVIRVGITRN